MLQRALSGFLLLAISGTLHAEPVLVNYPAHPATYGDHTIDATWVGGPVESLTVELQTDEAIVHDDQSGQSQRTARNTLNHTPPSDPANPQNYDNLGLIGVYGDRLPLLQQLSASGVSTLSYHFPVAVNSGFDLFVTDVDSSDSAVVQAFDLAGSAIDMTTWSLVDEGDLSLYKDTGTVFSEVVAPTPTTQVLSTGITFTAESSTNYNRSYSIVRAPRGVDVGRVDVTFTGIFNSPSRERGGSGSHIYAGIATIPASAFGDFDENGVTDAADYTIWRDTLGGSEDLRADGDLSGVVDDADYQLWRANYEGSPVLVESQSQVPEPRGWWAALWMVVAYLRKRGVASCKPS